MNIIIQILIALGALLSSGQFTQEFKNSNQEAMNKATDIYNSGNYQEVDGGVIISDDVNP